MKEHVRDERSSFDAVSLLCLLALLAITAANGILNNSIYPYVAGYFGVAREISTIAGGVVILAVYFVAVYRPSLLDARLFLVISAGCAVTAGFVLVVGMGAESGALTTVGFVFMQILMVWADIVTVLSLSTLEAKKSLACVAFGIAIGELLATVIPTLDPAVAVVVYMPIFLIIVIALYPLSAKVLESIASEEVPADLELTNPDSFPRPSNPFFICTLFLGLAMGYGLTLNAVENAPAYSSIQGLVLVVVAIWLVASRDHDKMDRLFSLSVLAVIAGLIMVPHTFSNDVAAANVLMRIGVKSFEMLLWIVALSIGRRNLLALLSTFAFAQAAMSIGVDIGSTLGNLTDNLVATSTELPTLIAEVALFAFIAFLWLAFRRFSFSDVIQGVAALRPASAVAPREGASADDEPQVDGKQRPPADFDEAVAALSAKHGLTPRETEVFALLARGRNGQAIMDKLVISRNTMKSHCRRIYAKLGVHSQQELIDLVEDAA